MRKDELGKGVIVPMITPLTSELNVDNRGVSNLIEHIISGGAAPFILGTTGESASIPESDRPGFVQQMVEVAQGRANTYAGISSPSFKTSVEAARHYFDLGVDAVVAHPPAYYPLSEDQLQKYFEMLLENIPGPLILYNITSVTHVSIPVKMIEKLSYHEKLIGVKDSERDLSRMESSLQLWSERDDFTYLVGWGAQMANGLKKGSDGLVPSTGNVTPKEYVEMMAAAETGDDKRLYELQELMGDISAIYQKNRGLGDSLAALKVMLRAMDICEIYMMPPLSNMNESEQSTIISQMQKYNLTTLQETE